MAQLPAELRVHGARVHGAASAPPAARAWLEREKGPPSAAAAAPPAARAGLEREKGPPPAPPEETRRLLDAGAPPPPPRETTLSISTGKASDNDAFEKKRKRLYDILRPPYFIISMIIVFVCMEVWAGERARAWLEYAPDRRREAWRLLTYSALHAGAQHLALNCLVALAVGWVLEREQGARRVAAVWAAGVVAGALGASALQPTVHVVGASAGVYALLTAHVSNVALGYGHVKLCWFRVLAVCVLGASDCAWLLLRVAPPPPAPPPPPVAWAAHALGAASGLPLALLLFTGVNAGRRAVLGARAASAALLAAGVAAAVLCNVYLHPDAGR